MKKADSRPSKIEGYYFLEWCDVSMGLRAYNSIDGAATGSCGFGLSCVSGNFKKKG